MAYLSSWSFSLPYPLTPRSSVPIFQKYPRSSASVPRKIPPICRGFHRTTVDRGGHEIACFQLVMSEMRTPLDNLGRGNGGGQSPERTVLRPISLLTGKYTGKNWPMHRKFRQEKPYILLNWGYLSDLWEISCYTDQGIIFAASANCFRCIRELPFSLICRLVPRYEAPASRWRRSPT